MSAKSSAQCGRARAHIGSQCGSNRLDVLSLSVVWCPFLVWASYVCTRCEGGFGPGALAEASACEECSGRAPVERAPPVFTRGVPFPPGSDSPACATSRLLFFLTLFDRLSWSGVFGICDRSCLGWLWMRCCGCVLAFSTSKSARAPVAQTGVTRQELVEQRQQELTSKRAGDASEQPRCPRRWKVGTLYERRATNV